jgi:hypothetical protein
MIPLFNRQALVGRVAGRYLECAAVRHGVSRIDCDVEHSEIKLARVDHDRPKIAGEIDFDVDVATQRSSEKVNGLAHMQRDIDLLRMQRLLP